MSDVIRLLGRQADWQRSLKDLSWPEKVKLVAKLRRQVLELRQCGPPGRDDNKERRG